MKLKTRLRSTFMRHVSSPGYQQRQQNRARLKRRLTGQAAAVHYFHEVADPYSHLVVQQLDALKNRYNLPFQVHLTSPEEADFRGDDSRYGDWARNDAASIAEGYGVNFPDGASPTTGAINTGIAALMGLENSEDFASKAIEVGHNLWSGQITSESAAPSTTAAGNQLRKKWGHYAGGMFWFDGEWYWGLDRLELLEARLIEEGFGSGTPDNVMPTFEVTGDTSHITLEIFPSLRSPYTAISFDRTTALADKTGVELKVRPVMPMMMRGVPAPQRKALYVMFDSAREGRRHGVPFGRIIDPFGDPVRRAYSLYPKAIEAGLERKFISRYLKAAWMDGIDITQAQGLRQVIEDIGLNWNDMNPSVSSAESEKLLEENVSDMLDAGLWGVPSYRVSGGDKEPFSCWGQDRLWRVEQEIASRAQ